MGFSAANTKFVQEVKQDFNKQKSTLAVFVDLKGASDTVWRTKLITKLKNYGVKEHMLNWIKRFLAQRWVKTHWGNIESGYKQSKVGLPQGAASSTTLFNVYINDLSERLKTVKDIKVSIFADDVVIWTSACNRSLRQKEKLEQTMNEALEELTAWSSENNMIVNKLKIVYQFFTLKHDNATFALKLDNDSL